MLWSRKLLGLRLLNYKTRDEKIDKPIIAFTDQMQKYIRFCSKYKDFKGEMDTACKRDNDVPSLLRN